MKRFFIYLGYLIISALVFLHGAKQPNVDGFDKARLHETIHGEAYKPFVYRALAPWVVKTVAYITPDFFKESLKNGLSGFVSIDDVFDKMSWPKEYYFEYLIAFAAMILSLFGFMVYLGKLAKEVFNTGAAASILIPIAAILSLPALFKYYIYIYDFPTLFLFTAAYFALAAKKFRFYYIIYVLACINKETALLLAGLYFCIGCKSDRKRALINTAWQAAVWLIIKLALYFIYSGNRGVFSEYNFAEYNLPYLLQPYEAGIVLLYIFFFVMLFYKWKEKPEFLRKAVWLGVPLAFLSLTIGVVDEIRIYYEIFPIVALLFAHSISLMTGFELKAKPQNSE